MWRSQELKPHTALLLDIQTSDHEMWVVKWDLLRTPGIEFLYFSYVAIVTTHPSQCLHNNSAMAHACITHVLQHKCINALQNLDFAQQIAMLYWVNYALNPTNKLYWEAQFTDNIFSDSSALYILCTWLHTFGLPSTQCYWDNKSGSEIYLASNCKKPALTWWQHRQNLLWSSGCRCCQPCIQAGHQDGAFLQFAEWSHCIQRPTKRNPKKHKQGLRRCWIVCKPHNNYDI